MKNRVLIVALGVTIGLTCVTSAFAKSSLAQANITSNSPYVQPVDENQSRIMKIQPRGSVISTGVLQINNRGNGNIGVYMQTTTHQEVDETTFGVYLDRWIESDKTWKNIDVFTFTYSKEEYPDDDLMMKSISFDIVGQPSDCYYRLRGAHLVVAGEVREMLSSQTDGILITKN